MLHLTLGGGPQARSVKYYNIYIVNIKFRLYWKCKMNKADMTGKMKNADYGEFSFL